MAMEHLSLYWHFLYAWGMLPMFIREFCLDMVLLWQPRTPSVNRSQKFYEKPTLSSSERKYLPKMNLLSFMRFEAYSWWSLMIRSNEKLPMCMLWQNLRPRLAIADEQDWLRISQSLWVSCKSISCAIPKTIWILPVAHVRDFVQSWED